MNTKFTLLVSLLLTTLTTFGQWTYKTISNGFDDPFKKAYTATNNNGWLAMEAGEPQEVVEYPDSIMKKSFVVIEALSISDKLSLIPYVKPNIMAYSTATSYVNKVVDSSQNISSDFVISISSYKHPDYSTMSYDLQQKQPTYKIVTTSGTYYIGDKEYYTDGFPHSFDLTYMGSGWSQANSGLIIELRNYMKSGVNRLRDILLFF